MTVWKQKQIAKIQEHRKRKATDIIRNMLIKWKLWSSSINSLMLHYKMTFLWILLVVLNQVDCTKAQMNWNVDPYYNTYVPTSEIRSSNVGSNTATFSYFEEKTEADRRYSKTKAFMLAALIIAVLAFVLAIIAIARIRQTICSINNLSAYGESTLIESAILGISACQTVLGLVDIRKICSITDVTSTSLTLNLAPGQVVPASWISSNERRLVVFGISNLQYNGGQFLPIVSADTAAGTVVVARTNNGNVPVLTAGAFAGVVPLSAESTSCGINIFTQDTSNNITTTGFVFSQGSYLVAVPTAQAVIFSAKVPNSIVVLNNQSYLNVLFYLANT